MTMEYTAKFLAQLLKGTVVGDENAKATKFAKIEHGKPGTLSFFANPKYEPYVYTSKASILIVDKAFEPKEPVTPTMVKVENAYSAIADLLKYTSEQKKKARRFRSCYAWWIPFTVKFGRKVHLSPFCYVGRHTSIGDGTYIHPHVHIGKDVTIGKNCIIYPGVVIYPGTVIGKLSVRFVGDKIYHRTVFLAFFTQDIAKRDYFIFSVHDAAGIVRGIYYHRSRVFRYLAFEIFQIHLQSAFFG